MKKNIQLLKGWILIMVYGMPVLAFAATNQTLSDLAQTATKYFNVAITLIISFAIVTFVFNVYRYFFTADVSAEKKKEAGLYVLYSTIGFFVILSFWGLVAILTNSIHLPNNQPSWPFNVGSGGGTPSGSKGTTITTPAGGGTIFTAPAGGDEVNGPQ